MPTPAQLARARVSDATKAKGMVIARLRDEANAPLQPLQQPGPPQPLVAVRTLVKQTPASDIGGIHGVGTIGGRGGDGECEDVPRSPATADQPPLAVVLSANDLREWQCALTLKADHALEGSMKTRALLRECEQLLWNKEQETRRAERVEHDVALASSSDDPVKQRRLLRCDELQACLARRREELYAHTSRLDKVAASNERLQRSLRDITFSDAEIQAELASMETQGTAAGLVGTSASLDANPEEAARNRAAGREARRDRAEKFLEGVDWSRLHRQ